MEKIKVLVVEDKALVAEDIVARLRNHGMDIVGSCDTGEEAVAYAKDKHPDLILMDIELAGDMDGIAATQAIHKVEDIPVIYLSDYTDDKMVERAKKTMPAGYLSKPFNEAELVRAIDIAFYNATHKRKPERGLLLNDRVFLRTENQSYIKLSLEEIIYLKASRSYCDVVTAEKIHVISNNMGNVNEQINSKDFVKVHRSHIINVNKITAINGNVIELGEQHEVQMSKEYGDELKSRLKFIK